MIEKFDEKDLNAYMREFARKSKRLGEENRMDFDNSSDSGSKDEIRKVKEYKKYKNNTKADDISSKKDTIEHEGKPKT